jgi:hypothetical protein
VSLDEALRSAAGLLRRRSGAVLPYYALRTATADVARLPLLVGAVVAYLALSSSGRLGPLRDDLAGLNPELLDPAAPASGLPPSLAARVAETLLSPTVLAPLAVAAGLAVVCYVLARGVTVAASLAAVAAGVDDGDALAAGVEGAGRWRTFAGLVVVRWGLLLLAAVPLLAALVGGVAALGSAPPADPAALDEATVGAVLALLGGGLVTAAGVLVVLALLAFAGPAAAVDGVGVRAAVRRSAGVPLAHPVGFLLYAVVVASAHVCLGVLALLSGVAGVGRLVGAVSAFLLAPLLDGVAVALYAVWSDAGSVGGRAGRGETGRVGADDDGAEVRDGAEDHDGGVAFDGDPDATTGAGGSDGDGVEDHDGDGASGGALAGTAAVFVGGLRELAGFCRRDWGYVAVAAAALGAGVAGGWGATAGSGVRIPTPSDPAAVFGSVPLGPFVNIAVNNWLVATSAGFSGAFAGLPTLGTLLFNGLLVGAVAGVVDPLVFLAFVGPHGVVELPAIAVAGGVGLRLGHVAVGAWRGTRPRAALVDEVGRTWRLVVGLAVVFVVAGFVEAFVTPGVAAAVLG